MKHIFRSLFLLFVSASPALATVYTYQVALKDVKNGCVIQQADVSTRASIKVLNAQYKSVASLPKGIVPDAAEHFTRRNGVEHKRPFAMVSIPAYTRMADGTYGVLTSFSLNIEEAAMSNIGSKANAKTAAAQTPLATGTWYKIAVPTRGVYKIDYAFVQSLGINASTISSANIRLVGNGGAMLYESNAPKHSLDLTENALWVNDGGDGIFGSGDFIAFYAPGPMRWDLDSLGQRFIHANHLYADSSYYFLSFDAGGGMRISDATQVGTSTTTVSSFDDYTAHEVDLYNPGKFGKEWWGEKFGAGSDALQTRTFSFPLNANVDTLRVRMSMAARAAGTTQIITALNNAAFDSYNFSGVSLEEDNNPVSAHDVDRRVPVNASTADFYMVFNNGQIEDMAYLNFIELNWRRPLAFTGNNFTFRDLRSVAPNAVATYNVSGAGSATQIWDVTDPLQPKRMQGTLNGSTYSFTQSANVLHEFVALDGSSFLTPAAVGKVSNQNLHGADAPELVIVTHPNFLSAANRLADYHREHDMMRVLVATTDQVYNEFSSGAQDIGGIRDMMRYFYLAAGNDTTRLPRYLLLFGDASYDYKNRIPSNSNYVPTYESNESLVVDASFTVDDYFGFLDDGEDIGDFTVINTLDIGVGRIPVADPTAAEDAVNKIINYTSPASLGPWRISNTFVGDNEDGAGEHLANAEEIARTVDNKTPFANDTKIYLDNLTFVSTPGGNRCPEANKAITDQIFKGTFVINYTGHGSTTTLAHERIVTKEDFNAWKNFNKLPFMITATCDYARYDNPAYVSNGESLILKKDGGTIAMLTTTGPVYAGINQEINLQFLWAQYSQRNGQWLTFGDAMREGKNMTYKNSGNYPFTLINFYRFSLLGDPALQPAFPKHVVRTDAITLMGTAQSADTMRALGAYTVSGHVEDVTGNLLSDFNGRAYVTIYDKPRVINLYTKEGHDFRAYKMQDNIIFKGLTTVTDGRFSCSFIAPKDMGYDYARGKISYYAENGHVDAAGYDTGVVIGGFYDGAPADNDAPVVKPFIGDTLFRDGGITGPNTLLYVQLSDKSGINVSGNGVGHDLTAVLDGDEAHPYILNDYYQTEPNTYQRGHASFPITGLADGPHTFRVRAWDVYNNSGEGIVHFVVGTGGFQVQNLMNYPNPFRDQTHFFFQHNHPGEALTVQIAIYQTTGQLVRIIEQKFNPADNPAHEVIWNGTDDHGALLPSGVYPYKVVLSTDKGLEGAAYQKLVITR
jgi:hypothetical protein